MTGLQHVRVQGTHYQRGTQDAAIASVLMDLNARRIWLAAGHPCQVPHQPLDVAL